MKSNFFIQVKFIEVDYIDYVVVKLFNVLILKEWYNPSVTY